MKKYLILLIVVFILINNFMNNQQWKNEFEKKWENVH